MKVTLRFTGVYGDEEFEVEVEMSQEAYMEFTTFDSMAKQMEGPDFMVMLSKIECELPSKQDLPPQKDVRVMYDGAWVIAHWVKTDPTYPDGIFYVHETGGFIQLENLRGWECITV